MDIGLFLPVGTNGFLISTTSPPLDPTFETILRIVQRAEEANIDFCLSMVKLHGFGGPSRYWDACLDSFTSIAGVLARTNKIKLFATAPILAFPPAICARAAATMDSIAPGRFGINIVTGWQKAEYDTMGLWPGESHYMRRYDYAREYVSILKMLWETGRCTLDGEFFKMKDCEVFPTPSTKIEIVCAGQSDEGMKFSARLGDYNFIGMRGINDPASVKPTIDRMRAIGDAAGRQIGAYGLVMVCADETREIAETRWRKYCEGIDHQALAWAFEQTSLDKVAMTKKNTSVAHLNEATREMKSGVGPQEGLSSVIAMSMGTFIGSYADVARMLDETAEIDGMSGVMVALADWHNDVDKFCSFVEPAMKSRANRRKS